MREFQAFSLSLFFFFCLFLPTSLAQIITLDRATQIVSLTQDAGLGELPPLTFVDGCGKFPAFNKSPSHKTYSQGTGINKSKKKEQSCVFSQKRNN